MYLHKKIDQIPLCPQSWYLVGSSRQVQPGKIFEWKLFQTSILFYRSQKNRQLYAIDPYCPHMGTHLKYGRVIQEQLRCPLHHWEYDGEHRCFKNTASIPFSHKSYPLLERYHHIFLFSGSFPLFEPSFFSEIDTSSFVLLPGKPISMRCPWYVVASNAFDLEHFQTVHRRSLLEPPVLEKISPYEIRIRFISQVLGETLADRTMKYLSKNRIEVCIRCLGGTLIVVETTLGKIRTLLLLGLQTTADGVQVSPIFGVSRSFFWGSNFLRICLTRWLFTAFLKKDIEFLSDIQFHIPLSELDSQTVFGQALYFMRNLPS